MKNEKLKIKIKKKKNKWYKIKKLNKLLILNKNFN